MMFFCNNQRNRCYRVSSSPFVPIEVRGSQFSLARQARDGGRLPGPIISDNQRWSEIAQDWRFSPPPPNQRMTAPARGRFLFMRCTSRLDGMQTRMASSTAEKREAP